MQKRVQSSSTPAPYGGNLPRFCVARGKSGTVYFRRRVPEELKPLVGQSTITIRLEGMPGGRIFQRSYDAALGRSETLLLGARSRNRKLSPLEILGVAGAWAERTPLPESSDSTYPEAVAAVLEALVELGIALPSPVRWPGLPEGIAAVALSEAIKGMLSKLNASPYPAGLLVDGGDLYGGPISHERASGLLEEAINSVDLSAEVEHWLHQATTQLQALGVAVDPVQRQLTAARIIRLAAVPKARQLHALTEGQLPPALPAYPPPPEPLKTTAGPTLQDAFSTWQARRGPAPKTYLDTQSRLAELKDWLGSDRLNYLDGEKAAAWRSDLLKDSTSLGAAKRKIALVRACLQAALDGGLPIDKAAIEALNTRSLREASGTRLHRQAFTKAQAGLLWQISRSQTGARPLDRWAIPLGLSLGCRLEELAGIRQEDVSEVDGIPVVVIQPSEDRRLKNDNSTRAIPIPLALAREGFIEWAKQQPPGLLFPEPTPPPTDPRLSHYASIRLGKLIRQQAGIIDPKLVFHCCRHTTAQQLVDVGVEQRLIEAVMGHTSKSMTARYSRQGPPLKLLAAALERRDWRWVPALSTP